MVRSTVVMAAAATMVVACASPRSRAPRRPLITDQTPLGMAAADVLSWFDAHGWCFDERGAERARAHLCEERQHTVRAVLGFRDGVLARAIVLVWTGPRHTTGPIPMAGSPSERRALVSHERDDAGAIVEGLAQELETRYGPPVDDSGAEPRLRWTTAAERIVLYLERNRHWIVERHTRAADPEEPVRVWATEAAW